MSRREPIPFAGRKGYSFGHRAVRLAAASSVRTVIAAPVRIVVDPASGQLYEVVWNGGALLPGRDTAPDTIGPTPGRVHAG